MTTDSTCDGEYEIRLDRDACEGIFACLVRDGRFAEAEDGLATIEGGSGARGSDEIVGTFDDDRIDDARQAAAACPVDAITVTEASHE
jgi:ferredoxin